MVIVSMWKTFERLELWNLKTISHLLKKHNMKMWKMKPYKYDRLYIKHLTYKFGGHTSITTFIKNILQVSIKCVETTQILVSYKVQADLFFG
jgi:hypothetical protein